MSSFASLNTALSGIMAQRYGLDLTGQNMANVSTPGYSRQRAEMQPVNPAAAPSIFARWDGAGSGVEVTGTLRLADALVDARARSEHQTAAQLDVAQSTWSRIDSLLSEPADNGLNEQLSAFFNAWADLSNQPGSTATRTAVIQTGRAVADRLQRLDADLGTQWLQRTADLEAKLADVNANTRAVAELNQAIRQGTISGSNVNELMDRRDVLVDDLVSLTGGRTVTHDDGTVDVYVGGTAAVRGSHHETLAIADTASDPRPTTLEAVRGLPPSAAAYPVVLQWSGGLVAQVPGGAVAGVVDTLNTVLPYAADRFDAVAADIATQVNTIFAGGLDRTGTAPAVGFFTGQDAGGTWRASMLDVDAAVQANPDLIAAAGAAEGPLGGANADAIAALAEDPDGPISAWRAVVTDLGAQAQAANRRVDVQAVAVKEADAARQSASGVDIDEELTRMVMFQRAYEASSRVLTAVDEALDVLINRTGLVGR